MTRWMHPPELNRERKQDRFDPVIEGLSHCLSRELSLAIWERVCALATDGAGRRDEEQARQRFHELATRIGARGGRLRPDVGRLTRVGVEIEGDFFGAWSTDELRPRTPGRETLVVVEAQKRMAGRVDVVTKHDQSHSASAPANSSTLAADRLTAHPQLREYVARPLPPWGRTPVDHGTRSQLGFDDYRVLGLKEVLQRLGPDHPLKQEIIAAAATTDRPIAGRATLWRERLPSVATPYGHALWRLAERHAATLYRRAVSSGMVDQHDPAVKSALQQRGTGQPLPVQFRREMEREFRISLAGVRIHTDAVATQAARALDAEAFTVGEDIFFAEGKFVPDTRSGRKLLAHELTHVVQALRGGTALTGDGLRVSQPGEPLEQEADAVAERIDQAAGSSPPAGQAARSPTGTSPPSAWNDSQQSGRSAAIDAGSAQTISRKTKGEEVVDSAHTNFLDPDVSVKADVDVMKAGLKEVKANKSVAFNRDAIKKKIESAL